MVRRPPIAACSSTTAAACERSTVCASSAATACSERNLVSIASARLRACEIEQSAQGLCFTVREGSDLTIVTLSQMVQKSVLAADQLAAEGISAEVLDLRTLVPLDRAAVLASVAKTGRLLVADEDYLSYGLSGEIAALVAENLDTLRLKAPVRRLAVPDVPIPFSRPLEQFAIPQVDNIVASARGLMTFKLD